jgi:tetratricopeptide (TPR) repeat protein
LEAYEQAIGLSPTDDKIHNYKGILLSDGLERDEEALQAFIQAIELAPHVAVYHRNKGTILHRLKRYNEALKAYQRAIGLGGKGDIYGLKGNTHIALQQYEEALAAYTRAVQLAPTSENYGKQGHAFFLLERYTEAHTALEQACELAPDDPDIHQLLSKVLELLSKEASDKAKSLKNNTSAS